MANDLRTSAEMRQARKMRKKGILPRSSRKARTSAGWQISRRGFGGEDRQCCLNGGLVRVVKSLQKKKKKEDLVKQFEPAERWSWSCWQVKSPVW